MRQWLCISVSTFGGYGNEHWYARVKAPGDPRVELPVEHAISSEQAARLNRHDACMEGSTFWWSEGDSTERFDDPITAVREALALIRDTFAYEGPVELGAGFSSDNATVSLSSTAEEIFAAVNVDWVTDEYEGRMKELLSG